MENTSKALIMAGGILLAIMVLGALLLMFNRVGEYQRGEEVLKRTTQLSEFNSEFTQYERNDVKGTDLVSLVNKIISYNAKGSGNQNVDDSIKINVEISLTSSGKSFKDKIGTNPIVFTKTKYSVSSQNDELVRIFNKMRELESRGSIGAKGLALLTSNINALETGTKTVKDILGKQISITISEIQQYEEYSRFKESTFKVDGNSTTYQNGQIAKMKFVFLK